MTKTIHSGDLIRLPAWSSQYAEVTTLRAYCGDDKDRLAHSRERGHDEVFCTYAGSAITSDRSYYLREKARYASAIVVEDGEAVQVEGRPYRIRVMPNNHLYASNSDPIYFTPN